MPTSESGPSTSDIDRLLERSAEFGTELSGLLEACYPNETPRVRSARIMCRVAFEHGHSVLHLVAIGNFTSAVALVRVQYEALVRALWVRYAASDADLMAFTAELGVENAKRIDGLPMAGDMLKALAGSAPDEAVRMLQEFRSYSWKPLSSYVHGGAHALQRHGKGYPTALLRDVLLSSNGVTCMAGMLVVLISENPNLAGVVPQIQRAYSDCLKDLQAS